MRKNRLMTVLPLAVMLMPVVASANVTEIQNAADGNLTEVFYEQASSYSVVIPKSIYLDVDSKDSDYTVTVSGGIASDKRVTVIPSDLVDSVDGINFYMIDITSTGDKKSDVLATVTQENTVWSWSEVENAVSKNGRIAAPDLTPGSWKGAFQFNISLTDITD